MDLRAPQVAVFGGCEFSLDPAGKLILNCGGTHGSASTETRTPDGYYALSSRISKVGGLPEAELRGRDPEVAFVLENSGKLDECTKWDKKDSLERQLPESSKATNLAIDVFHRAFKNLGGKYRRTTRESVKRVVKGLSRLSRSRAYR